MGLYIKPCILRMNEIEPGFRSMGLLCADLVNHLSRFNHSPKQLFSASISAPRPAQESIAPPSSPEA